MVSHGCFPRDRELDGETSPGLSEGQDQGGRSKGAMGPSKLTAVFFPVDQRRMKLIDAY